MIIFPFLGAGFANIPSTFLISYEVQTSYLKTFHANDQIYIPKKHRKTFSDISGSAERDHWHEMSLQDLW